MRFTPKSDEELSNVWNSDWYEGVIEEAEEKQSSKGTDMLVLGVRVYGHEGRTKKLPDYIVEAVAFKLKHLAEAASLSAQYESGELHASQLINKKVGVKLRIEIDKTGQYPDKNVIADYRPLQAAKPAVRQAPAGTPVNKQRAADKAAEEVGDDGIPFLWLAPFIGTVAAAIGSIV